MARRDVDEDDDIDSIDDSEVPDWSTIAAISRTNFGGLCEELIEAQEKKEEAEAAIKEIRGHLADYLIKAHVKRVGYLGRKVTRKDGMSSSISKELLLKKAKLSLKMVEACTVKRPWTTVVIGPPPKQKED